MFGPPDTPYGVGSNERASVALACFESFALSTRSIAPDRISGGLATNSPPGLFLQRRLCWRIIWTGAEKCAVIEAITFDLWETLIRETSESARKVKETRVRNLYVFLQGQEFPGTIEQVEKAHERVGERLEEIWARQEDVGAEEQVRLFLEALDEGWEMSQDPMALANLEWAYVSAVLHALPGLNRGAVELLDGLRGQYRLGLICNTGRVPGTMLKIILRRLGILDHFDVLTFSDGVGIRKPDPQIFHLTLEPLGIAPDHALHVGDNVATDVLGARGVGMWAVLLGSLEASTAQDTRVRAIATLEELPRVLQEVQG